MRGPKTPALKSNSTARLSLAAARVRRGGLELRAAVTSTFSLLLWVLEPTASHGPRDGEQPATRRGHGCHQHASTTTDLPPPRSRSAPTLRPDPGPVCHSSRPRRPGAQVVRGRMGAALERLPNEVSASPEAGSTRSSPGVPNAHLGAASVRSASGARRAAKRGRLRVGPSVSAELSSPRPAAQAT